MEIIIFFKAETCTRTIIAMIRSDENFCFRFYKKMNVVAFNAQITGEDVGIFKGKFSLIAIWKKVMISLS